MIAAMLAISENGAIGNNNELPWPRLEEDMKWFREHTKGHAVAMGRATWDSLPSRPLPSRANIVISRNHGSWSDIIHPSFSSSHPGTMHRFI